MRYTVHGRAGWLAPAIAALLTACGSGGPTDAASDPPLPLHALADIRIVPANPALKGRTLRMDYESIDARNRLLFVAYLGAGEVVAIHIGTNVVIGPSPA